MTDYLFTLPSFTRGMAQALDFGGNFEKLNTSESPDVADTRALAADFLAVGRDILAVLMNERERVLGS